MDLLHFVRYKFQYLSLFVEYIQHMSLLFWRKNYALTETLSHCMSNSDTYWHYTDTFTIVFVQLTITVLVLTHLNLDRINCIVILINNWKVTILPDYGSRGEDRWKYRSHHEWMEREGILHERVILCLGRVLSSHFWYKLARILRHIH